MLRKFGVKISVKALLTKITEVSLNHNFFSFLNVNTLCRIRCGAPLKVVDER